MSTNFVPAMSTDEVCVGSNTNLCLTDYLDSLETDVGSKAPSTHGHSDLEAAIEGLEDGKAEAVHTHEMSAIVGLNDALAELEEAIANIQGGGTSGNVAPMLVASMHLGKLDNNSGAETASSTRICSDPISVEPGNSYWQVNNSGVNMYVLIYDADELFLGYLGSFASGAEIAITNPNAAYMRLGSLIGNYDLANEYRIYNVDPASGGSSGGGAVSDGYSCAEADARFAPKDHTHDGYAAANHTHTNDHAHSNRAVLDGITAEKVAAWDAGTGSGSGDGSGYVHPSTHPASMITGLAAVATSGRYADLEGTPEIPVIPAALPANGGNADTVGGKYASEFASSGHTHSGYAASNHSHTEYAASGHTHTASAVGAASSSHTHTPASIGAAAASHTHDYAASNHTHSGYASTSHGHANYASSTHSHTASDVGALPSSGGTVSGDFTVMGTVVANGVLNTQTIMPKDAGSYSIGSSDKRYYSTYLKVSPNVSSDIRCKRDIAALDAASLAEFVRKLAVVSYNYNDDAADEAKKIGLIAQDVIAADPDISRFFVEQDAKGFFSLRPADLVFPLIAAVQQLSAEVAELKGNK